MSGSSGSKYSLLEQELDNAEDLFGMEGRADPREKLLRKGRGPAEPQKGNARHNLNSSDDDDDGAAQERRFRDENAPLRQSALPLKTFLISLFLFLFGSVVLVVGFLIQTGHINHGGDSHLGWMFLFIGFVTFIPGIWALSVAIMTYIGVEGYDDYGAIPGED